jgi:hypothetical protein
MSFETPETFLTVAFGIPVDIGLLPREPVDDPGELLTVGWQAKLGTSYLPYDPGDPGDPDDPDDPEDEHPSGT